MSTLGLQFGDWSVVRPQFGSAFRPEAVNTFSWPTGHAFGSGHILLPRSVVQEYLQRPPAEQFLPLTWSNLLTGPTPYSVTLPAISILRADEYCANYRGDETIMLCRVVDIRWWWERTSCRRNYNVRRISGDYYAETLNSGEPWTWQEILDDLWARLIFPQGPFDFSVPQDVSFPVTPPDNLHFQGLSVWTAICTLLDYAGLVPVYLSETQAWSVVRIADLASTEDDFLDDYAAYRSYWSRSLINSAAYAANADVFSNNLGDRYGSAAFRVDQETISYTGITQMPGVRDVVWYPFANDEANGDIADEGADIAKWRNDLGRQQNEWLIAAAVDVFRYPYCTLASWRLTDSGTFTYVERKPLPALSRPVYQGASEVIQVGTSVSRIARGQTFDWLPSGATDAIQGLEVGMMPSGVEIPEGAEAAIHCARIGGQWQLVSYDCDKAEEI